MEIYKKNIYDVRVFFNRTCQGNTAKCFISYNKPAIATMLARSKETAATCCFMWPGHRPGENILYVRYYQRGTQIQFCGHGLLAAAYVWSTSVLPQSNSSEPMVLRAENQEYLACWQQHRLWLRSPRIHCQKIELPEDIDAWFEELPECSALAGSGYRIFEFSRGINIANLQVNMQRINLDARAVIVTQRKDKAVDYSLRYFAPQYGNDEDSATGSANVVLADYWSQAGLKPPFRAHQCSAKGGEIFSHLTDDGAHVFIGGNIEIIAESETHEKLIS